MRVWLLKEYKKRCSVCGKMSIQRLPDVNYHVAPDLDWRSGSPRCGYAEIHLEECPHCGYVGLDISYAPTVTSDWLKSNRYVFCDNRNFEYNLSKRFYRYYLICTINDWHREAFYAALHAAWACDDAQDVDNAVYCRLKALEELDKFVANEEENETFLLMRADLLRRTGQFYLLIKEYEGKTFSDELLNVVVDFQVKKAKQKDVARYSLAHLENANDLYEWW